MKIKMENIIGFCQKERILIRTCKPKNMQRYQGGISSIVYIMSVLCASKLPLLSSVSARELCQKQVMII